MSAPLWQKAGIDIDARIMRFLAGDDVILDRELLPHDITASRAQATSLRRIGILSDAEEGAIRAELDRLSAAVASGEFVLDKRFEDCHSAIESWLVDRLGDTGRRIHTGRSRNDQVLVALRLWMKQALSELAELDLAIAAALLDRATAEAMLPLPGYTHLQRAMVSSVGMWAAGFAEAFLDDAVLAHSQRALIDSNPLGTASGFGVNLALPRADATRELGFASVQWNPVYAQLSRGKFELVALDALAQALLDLRRLAWDLSLFTTSEFGFVDLPAKYTTGSSLMPNKRNPDVVELLRASYAVVAGARSEIENLLSLPSGYQRDLQFSKGPLIRAFRHGLDALALLPELIGALRWRPDAMRAALEPTMYATDVALEKARAGVPFRQAYREAAEAAGDPTRTPEASLAARVSPGAAADLRLDALQARLAALRGG
jgi:argininosuccinate lyase